VDERDETAGVALPPPLIFGSALAIGLWAGTRLPDVEQRVTFARFLGAASVIGGIGIGIVTMLTLKRAGTSASPYAPSTALVTTGVFRFSRNPAYFGATAIYIGAAMFARSIPAFVALPIALALLDRLVVAREEAYLERKFGAAYRAYYAAVPRWF
jgi:protein-S-isoprenylcysteine O-methyltransferase Ste14